MDAQTVTDPEEGREEAHMDRAARPRWRKKRWRIAATVMSLLSLAAALTWVQREQIAQDVITDLLKEYNVQATYDLAQVGPDRQVLRDIVLGDPSAPDMTIKSAVITLRYRLGAPEIAAVALIEPRLFGRWDKGAGRLSFGSLDSAIYAESDGEQGLPDLRLTIEDGRARIDTPWGLVGAAFEGQGPLDNGFAGTAALLAPTLALDGCDLGRSTLYGEVTTTQGSPQFQGPLRMAALDCGDLALGQSSVQFTLDGDPDLAGFDVAANLELNGTKVGQTGVERISGPVRGTYREAHLRGSFDLAGEGLGNPYARVGQLGVAGDIRGTGDFTTLRIDGDVSGSELGTGQSFAALLADLGDSGGETPLGPLSRKFASNLSRQLDGGEMVAQFRFTRDENGDSLIIPDASVDSGSGDRILALSRARIRMQDGAIAALAGNIAMRGPGLPTINGRMERSAEDRSLFRLRMAEYSAGSSSLAIPEMLVTQALDTTLVAGEVEMSGPMPDGIVEGLTLPIRGRLRGGTIALWDRCSTARFERLTYAALTLTDDEITVCPLQGQPVFQQGPRGTTIAAGMPDLDVSGALGDSPIAFAAGSLAISNPGGLSASDLQVTLGEPGEINRIFVEQLSGDLGDTITGTFAGLDAALYAVPLDVSDGAGEWRFSDGALSLGGTEFVLTDRESVPRFEPLEGRNASLTFVDDIVSATAPLYEPQSGRLITRADIVHNIATSTGHADLDIPGIRFDDQLQPVALTANALGIIANAEGVVRGTGRIDWNANAVTSTGEFTTDGLDFAAAFGPVKGASGTVRFDDLLGLETAPNQTLKVASINPGVEVTEGEVAFDLQGGEVLSLRNATWPFMGGTLTMKPVTLTFGASEERRYIFAISGLEASEFVQTMELGNISATGKFDGEIVILFDEQGDGFIEEGLLVSRDPGGNVSYVGELTYEDLSPIANFAFASLRSLDYERMEVSMSGPLAGELVTTVRFDGVSQGEGADSNIITRRIASLPIRFIINIRAPFYQLITSLRSIYDPAFVRDPRELGLLTDDGVRLREDITASEVIERDDEQPSPDDLIPGDVRREPDVSDEPTIHSKASETMP